MRKSTRLDLAVEFPLIYFDGEEKSEEPDMLCMLVRKHLKDKRIKAVSQHNLDRVVVLDFEPEQLILELFGKGNIIAVKEGKTIACMRTEHWSDREIRAGKEYKFPQGKRNPELGIGEIAKEGELVKVLVRELNLTPKYCEELCLRAGYAKDLPAKDADFGKIERALKELIHGRYSPVKYMEGETLIDLSPFPLGIYKKYKEVPIPSLSSALKEIPRDLPKEGKTKKILGDIKADFEERKKLIEEYSGAGDFIYSHYNEVKEILKNQKTDQRVKKREGKYIEAEV